MKSNNNYAELKYKYVKSGMTVAEAYLYAYILRWNEVSGKAVSYNNGQIANELGITSRSVKNALAGLRNKEFIKQKGRHPRQLWAVVF
jgi:DNA-binding MarR family transcriptional regulator